MPTTDNAGRAVHGCKLGFESWGPWALLGSFALLISFGSGCVAAGPMDLDGEAMSEDGEDGPVAGAQEELFFTRAYLGGSPLSDVDSVARGGKANCALTYAGHVYCWGNWNGTRKEPFRPFGATRMRAVETDGRDYFCAIREADGVVQCVGRKTAGAAFASSPQTIVGLTNVSSISMGGDNRCVVVGFGDIHCWGRYALGRWNFAYVDRPVRIGEENRTSAWVSVGPRFACKQSIHGSVSCWGMWNPMQPGNPAPANVPMNFRFDKLRSLSVGLEHACILGLEGRYWWSARPSVYCWGRSTYGQLGSYDSSVRGPTRVFTDYSDGRWNLGARPLASGSRHSCYRTRDSRVRCWGRNDQGQLGNGTTATWLPPVTVSGLRTAYEVGVGVGTSCAVLDDDTVKCWGDNAYGQTTSCGTTDQRSPVTVVSNRTCTSQVLARGTLAL